MQCLDCHAYQHTEHFTFHNILYQSIMSQKEKKSNEANTSNIVTFTERIHWATLMISLKIISALPFLRLSLYQDKTCFVFKIDYSRMKEQTTEFRVTRQEMHLKSIVRIYSA